MLIYFVKFVESKYRIDINAAAVSQLNRAITHGHEKGVFVLPKGGLLYTPLVYPLIP
jgi:hypothetical protein